jgi:hypothetical protein
VPSITPRNKAVIAEIATTTLTERELAPTQIVAGGDVEEHANRVPGHGEHRNGTLASRR